MAIVVAYGCSRKRNYAKPDVAVRQRTTFILTHSGFVYFSRRIGIFPIRLCRLYLVFTVTDENFKNYVFFLPFVTSHYVFFTICDCLRLIL